MGQVALTALPHLGIPLFSGVHFKDRKDYIENLELHSGVLLFALLLVLIFWEKNSKDYQISTFIFSKK